MEKKNIKRRMWKGYKKYFSRRPYRRLSKRWERKKWVNLIRYWKSSQFYFMFTNKTQLNIVFDFVVWNFFFCQHFKDNTLCLCHIIASYNTRFFRSFDIWYMCVVHEGEELTHEEWFYRNTCNIDFDFQ